MTDQSVWGIPPTLSSTWLAAHLMPKRSIWLELEVCGRPCYHPDFFGAAQLPDMLPKLLLLDTILVQVASTVHRKPFHRICVKLNSITPSAAFVGCTVNNRYVFGASINNEAIYGHLSLPQQGRTDRFEYADPDLIPRLIQFFYVGLV